MNLPIISDARSCDASFPFLNRIWLTVQFISERQSLTGFFESQSATCRVRNAFGGAETFEANVAFATKTRMSFNASVSKPLSSDLKTRGEVSLFGLERDNSSFASSSEGLRGLRAVVRVS